MKYLFLLLFALYASLSMAIDGDLKDIQKTYWSQGSYSDVIPEQWKNESAVIIYQSFYNEYTKIALSGKLEHRSIVRRRIKLQDQAAVNQFSFFEYDPFEKRRQEINYLMSVKVIKPDGLETVIDTSYAENVYEDDEIVKKKLAVPDLAPGDIIDYFEVEKNVIKRVGTYFEFPIKYLTLTWDHPVIKQEIEFKALRKCHINFKSLNGAPEFKPNINDDEYVSYLLVDEMRDKNEESIWVNKIASLPSIKFKILYSSSDYKLGNYNFYDAGSQVKTSVSKQDVLDFLNHQMPESLPLWLNKGVDGPVSDKIEKIKSLKTEKEKLLAYYQLGTYYRKTNRDYIRTTRYNRLLDDNSNMNNLLTYFYPVVNYCRDNNINHELVVAPSKHLSKIEDIISSEELFPMLKVNLNNEEIYFYPNCYIAPAGEIPYFLQGVKGYTVKLEKRTSHRTIKEITIPFSDTHVDINEIEVHLKPEKDLVQINNNITKSGFFKYDKITELKMDLEEMYYPFLTEKNHRVDPPKYDYYGVPQYYRAARGYGINFKDYDYDVTQLGISFDHPSLSFHEVFSYEDKIYTIGNENYLISLNRCVPKQMKIPKADRENRTLDVYMTVPRSYQFNLKIAAPEGYELDNWERLNTDFDNEIGSFKSEVKYLNGILYITTVKTYKNDYFKSDKWNKVIDFTDFVYDFFSHGVVLKKANI